MKRIVCAVLCLALLLATAGSLAATGYTLPEKMQKQLGIGSGLKGTVTLHGEGTHPFILAIQTLQDVELEFRGLRSSGESHYFLYQAGENEERIGLTELYDSGDRIFLRSDLLPDQVFSIPALNQLADLLYTPEGGNPSLASSVLNWINLPEAERSALLNPVTESLSARLEMWVAKYAAVSEVRTLENGTSVLDLSYDIPMSELKKEIVSLYTGMLESAEGQALIGKIMNEEQRQVFARSALDYFYQAALDALDNDYDILYTRTLSTLGEPVSSILELPLDASKTQFQAIIMEEQGDLLTITLRSEDVLYTVTFGANTDLTQVDAFSAWINVRPNPASDNINLDAYHAWRADISHSGTISTDEDSRDHERTNWSIRVVTDTSRLPEGETAEHYPEENPLSLDLKLHYFSKYSQSSPTTLEFEAALTMEDFSLSAAGQCKTASPWAFAPFETEGAEDLTALSEEARILKLAELLAAASEQFTPSAKEEPEAEEGSEPAADETPETGEEENPETAEEETEETTEEESENPEEEAETPEEDTDSEA